MAENSVCDSFKMPFVLEAENSSTVAEIAQHAATVQKTCKWEKNTPVNYKNIFVIVFFNCCVLSSLSHRTSVPIY